MSSDMRTIITRLTQSATRFSRGAAVMVGIALVVLMAWHVADCKTVVDQHHHNLVRSAQIVHTGDAASVTDPVNARDGAGGGDAGNAAIYVANIPAPTLVPAVAKAPVSGLFGLENSRNTGLAHRRLTVFLI